MQYDVFISYARKDYADEQTKEVIPGNIVSRIKQLLDDNGLTYWFDEMGIYSGDQFVGVLADAIEQSSIFLYISTEASNASKWTINEIATAKHLDKKIIPFRYDRSKYNNAILMYLAPLDYVDYPKSKDKAFGQLLASIKVYKQNLEYAEQERLRAAEQIRLREQEAIEKQKLEFEKRARIKEINLMLDTLSTETQKKKEELASINIVLEGLESRRANLNGELAFLTGGDEAAKGGERMSQIDKSSSKVTFAKKVRKGGYGFLKHYRFWIGLFLCLVLCLCVWALCDYNSLIKVCRYAIRRIYQLF